MDDDPNLLPAEIRLAFVALELRSFLKELWDLRTNGDLSPDAYDIIHQRLLDTIDLANAACDDQMDDETNLLPTEIRLAFTRLELRAFLKELRDLRTQGHLSSAAYDLVRQLLLDTVDLSNTVRDDQPVEP